MADPTPRPDRPRDVRPDAGTAGADSPPGGGRGRPALLGLVALVAFVALLMWLLSEVVQL